jgi:hypothetical protein
MYSTIGKKQKIHIVSRLNNNTTPKQVYRFREVSVISFLHQKNKTSFSAILSKKRKQRHRATKNTATNQEYHIEGKNTPQSEKKGKKHVSQPKSYFLFFFAKLFLFFKSPSVRRTPFQPPKSKKTKLPFFLI